MKNPHEIEDTADKTLVFVINWLRKKNWEVKRTYEKPINKRTFYNYTYKDIQEFLKSLLMSSPSVFQFGMLA